MEQRISIITLGVADLGRARAFYDAMGWQVAGEEHADTIVRYDLNGIGIALFATKDLAVDAGILPEVPAFRGVALAYNVRSREEVAAVLAEAERAGARITKPAEDLAWGGHGGYFADPDGHLWEVCWNPFSPLTEDGSFRW